MTASHVSIREELIFLLNQATELEHSLSCSYLFTAFSLKTEADGGLPPETVAPVARWKRVFRDIAVEEMMHLAVINDLLIAVGAAPNFDRANFPHGCGYYMPDLQIELRPFSESLVRHFVAVEQPTGGTLPLVPNPDVHWRVEGDLDNEIGPDPYELASQGDIYGVILNGLREMVGRLGEDGVFIGPAPSQALRSFFEYSGWEPIRDLASAERALERVVEQGEGGTGENADSHFNRFSGVLEEFLALRELHPGFEPALPALANPFARTPPEGSGPVNLFNDELAIQVSDLFNETYGAMLQLLARFFVTTTETDAEAGALGDASIEAMIGGLQPLGELLTRLPAGTSHPGLTAGPSFVVHTLHPLPHKEAAWHLLRERFGELRDYARRISGHHGGDPALEASAASMDRIVGLLTPAD